jgi:PAS domain S-box-containing protein
MRLSLEKQIWLTGGVLFGALLAVGAAWYRSLDSFVENSRWVEHTHEVIAGINQLHILVLDRQRALRGFVLTGEENTLQPFHEGQPELDRTVRQLRETLRDHTQRERLKRLEGLLDRRTRFAAELVAVWKEKGQAAAVDLNQGPLGAPMGEEIRFLLSEMTQYQQVLLNQRNAQQEESAGRTKQWMALVALVALTVFFLGGSAIQRSLRAQRQAQEDLDRFFTLSLDLMCVADSSGRFRRMNPAWEAALGFGKEELLSRPYLEFVHPDDRTATEEETRRLAVGGQTVAFENRYRTKDGTYRWLSWKSTTVPQLGVTYATARDVTETKESAERLQQQARELEAANKELEAFTYSVSHDLRAPLRHIDGFSKILMEEFNAALPPDAQRYLARVRQGTQQMGRLVDDLLNLARVGRQEVRLQVTGLDSVVREVRAELHRDEEGREVEWQVGALPFVECDPALIKQVFTNLLSNALKYTRPRAKAVIEVGHRRQNGQPVIFVRDNGVGFNMKYAEKLFGVFQRLHRAEDFEGTGVGLATVQRIVHKHGGQVWAEAELDKGASFFFSLGGAEEAPQQPAATDLATEVSP